MQTNVLERERENDYLNRIVQLEDLVEKKISIHSRLLMDVALAEDMQTLAARHEKRKAVLYKLINGEKKEKKGSMDETNKKENGK